MLTHCFGIVPIFMVFVFYIDLRHAANFSQSVEGTLYECIVVLDTRLYYLLKHSSILN